MDPMGTNINSSFHHDGHISYFHHIPAPFIKDKQKHAYSKNCLDTPKTSGVKKTQETFAKAAFALLDSQIPRNTKASLPVKKGSIDPCQKYAEIDYP